MAFVKLTHISLSLSCSRNFIILSSNKIGVNTNPSSVNVLPDGASCARQLYRSLYICPQRIRRAFTEEDRANLIKVQKHTGSWRQIKNLYFPNRAKTVVIQSWHRAQKRLQQSGLQLDEKDAPAFFELMGKIKAPRFKWTAIEDKKLLSEVSSDNFTTWSNLATMIYPGLTDAQVYMRYQKLCENTFKGKWSDLEKNRLKFGVKTFGFRWRMVSEYVGTRSIGQCRTKWHNVLNPDISTKKWESAESNKLLQLVLNEPAFRIVDGLPFYSETDWTDISCNFPDRTGNQCWQHFFSHLERRARHQLGLEEINTKRWTAQETELLTKLVLKYSSNWERIAREFRTRTRIQCKTRWATLKLKARCDSLILNQIVQKPPTKRGSKCFPHGPFKEPLGLGAPDRKRFTPIQDEAILRLYRLLGPKWEVIKWCEPNFSTKGSSFIRERFRKLTRMLSKHYFLRLPAFKLDPIPLLTNVVKTRGRIKKSLAANSTSTRKRTVDLLEHTGKKRLPHHAFSVYEDEALLRLFRLLGEQWSIIAWCDPILLYRRVTTFRSRLLRIIGKAAGPKFLLLTKGL